MAERGLGFFSELLTSLVSKPVNYGTSTNFTLSNVPFVDKPVEYIVYGGSGVIKAISQFCCSHYRVWGDGHLSKEFNVGYTLVGSRFPHLVPLCTVPCKYQVGVISIHEYNFLHVETNKWLRVISSQQPLSGRVASRKSVGATARSRRAAASGSHKTMYENETEIAYDRPHRPRITASDKAFADCFIVFDREEASAWATAEKPMEVER